MKIPQLIQLDGCKPFSMHTHARKDLYISESIRTKGIWEPFETKLVLSLLGAGDVFVDVGANIGWFSLIAAGKVGRAGRVFSFEPDLDNFQILARNIATNRLANVCPIQAALSDSNETKRLYRSAENLGDHRLFDAGIDSRETLEVECIDASTFFEKATFPISMVKSDTQGFEGKVFSGFAKLFRESGELPTVLAEYWPRGLAAAGDDPLGFLGLFRNFGYSIHLLDYGSGTLNCIDPSGDSRLTEELFAASDFEAHVNLLFVPGGGRLVSL